MISLHKKNNRFSQAANILQGNGFKFVKVVEGNPEDMKKNGVFYVQPRAPAQDQAAGTTAPGTHGPGPAKP